MNPNLKKYAEQCDIDLTNGIEEKLEQFANLILNHVSMVCNMTGSGIVKNKDIQEGRKIASEIIKSRTQFWFQSESYPSTGE